MRQRFNRRAAFTGACALVIAPLWALPAQASPEGDDVVINEVFARGGSANQAFANRFIELYNPTSEEIDLSGYYIAAYSGGNGNNSGSPTALSGTIAPGGYFLIEAASNGDNGDPLPEPDLVTSFNFSGKSAIVALGHEGLPKTIDGSPGDVAGSDSFVDIVGYNTEVAYEGAAADYPGGNGDAGSITRDDAGTDTDNNAADFEFVSDPTPTNSNGDTVDPGDGEDPGPDPEPGEVIPIEDIQGTGSATPLEGKTVTTRGVVTAAYPTGLFNGAYIQTPGTGGEMGEASSGLFVYSAKLAQNVEIGDYVEVTGVASEYYGLTQVKTDSTYSILDDVEDPVAEVTPYVLTEEDMLSEENRERLEGMLVDASQLDLTVTDTYATNGKGTVALALGDEPLWQETELVSPVNDKAEYEALVASNEARSITLDDGSSWDYLDFRFDNHETPVPYISLDNPVRVGETAMITDSVILDYRYQWNFQPTSQVTGEDFGDVITFSDGRASELDAPGDLGGDITLASFNVLNYFTTLGVDVSGTQAYTDREGNPITTKSGDPRGAWDKTNLERQQGKIVAAINQLDASIVGLEEIENSARFGKDRDQALSDLVAALNEDAGTEKWSYVESPEEVPGQNDEDVIRLAFIYQADQVAPVGESTILLGNSAFGNAREPLGQSWTAVDADGDPVGDEFATVANHLKSKGSGTDDGTNQGNANPDRIKQAKALADFVDETFGDMPVFLLGDFNAYTAEQPIDVLREAGYTDLVSHEGAGEHTYSYGSRIGSLDHVFANEAALESVTGTDVWNINSSESIALEYSRYNYNVSDLFEADNPFRSSDHDPIKVGISTDGVPEPGPIADDYEIVIDGLTVEAGSSGTTTAAIAPELEESPVFAVTDAPEGWTASFDGDVLTVSVPEGTDADDYGITVSATYSDDSVDTADLTVTVTSVVVPPVKPTSGNLFYVKNGWDQSGEDARFAFGRKGDEVYGGDWDGDGVDTLAVRRGIDFFVKNDLAGGNADTVFTFGRMGDEVLVGDWDNDGKDTFGLRRGYTFYLSNSLTGGWADTSFNYGRATDEVLVGDWDGDGVDTVTLRRGSTFHVSNSLTGGWADTSFNYGRASDEVFAGDFDGDGHDTIGIRRGNVFHLKNSLGGGNSDVTLGYGRASDDILIGDWDGDGIDTPTVHRYVAK